MHEQPGGLLIAAASLMATFFLLPSSIPSVPAQQQTPVGNIVEPSSFGAVGDGTTDDTAALQRALDSLEAGDTLIIPAGKTYRHTDVLTIRNAGVRLSGPGTLLATNEERSALSIDADDVTVDGG